MPAGHGFAPTLTCVLLAACCGGLVAAVCAVAEGLSVPLFGSIAVGAVLALAGGALAGGLHWTAAQTAAVLAVAVFACGQRALRFILRAAGLNAPQLPRTADELQQGVDPESSAAITRKTARAVAYLNVLATVNAASCVAAALLLTFARPGPAAWLFAAILALAVLLRAGTLSSAWQRMTLVVGGGTALAVMAAGFARSAYNGSPARILAPLLLAAVTALLLTAARALPGKRLLPVWGHTADLLDGLTAVALVPLLLQIFHVYAQMRALIH
jgi:hypothetical protein